MPAIALDCGRSRRLAALFFALAAFASAQDVPSGRLLQLPDVNSLPTPPARLPIYFPPEPPAAGAGIDRIGPLLTPTWDAPPELAAYIGEPFYAPFGTLVAERALTSKQRKRIDEFFAKRRQLREALHARGAAAEDLSNPAEPSFEQAEALAKLEAEADDLRRVFCKNDVGWGSYRTWAAGQSEPDDTPLRTRTREYQVLRAAPYYTEGLSPAQRRLLRELSFELAPLAFNTADLRTPPPAPGAIVFFLPETARVRLPVVLTTNLTTTLDAFLHEKTALKKEIATEVIRLDSRSLSKRTRALQALAQKHAPRLAALEQQAEEIRRLLAALPPAPPAPTLPPAAVALTHDYQRARQSLHDELIARLKMARRGILTYEPGCEVMMWSANFSSGAYVLMPTRNLSPLGAVINERPPQRQRSATATARIKAVMDHFTADTAARQQALDAQRAQLIVAMLHAMGFARDMDEKIPPDVLRQVAEALRALQFQDPLPAFADYETAVLRPGLSPAQRRLLLNQACENLALPLPAAVRRPVWIFE